MPLKKKHIKKRKVKGSNCVPRRYLHDPAEKIQNTDAVSFNSTRPVTSGNEYNSFFTDCNNVKVKTIRTLQKIHSKKLSEGLDKNRHCRSCRLIIVKKKVKKPQCNDGEVKRIYSPFNRFASMITRREEGNRTLKIPPRSDHPQMGLSPKEKSYLICSFQTESSRYANLKVFASNAIKANKIFTIYGNCKSVREELLERGWIEKISPYKMNLSKIRNGYFANKVDVHNELERLLLSNLVEKHTPKFIWQTKEAQRETAIDMTQEYSALMNKLKINALWTSKQGLCSSMKRNYWFYIENVAEVDGPRTYNSYDAGDIEGFVKDFRITACTSLLKWVLSMVSNDRPIFAEDGKISINVLLFALNRCKEYLLRKQNKDIDRTMHNASSTQWNVFIKKYYCIISKNDVFTCDRNNKLPLYLGYAKFLLKEIHKYRPQLSCEGCHNIWIIKPGHCSRGRGIHMASKLNAITELLNKANMKYVIQKYIEEPLLVHDTKFDIRQYYLVTSTYPLVIWMYKDCYLKFSSQRYNLKDYHESIHLTNNAVQRKYKNCRGRHKDLPQNNMWDSDTYKEYLNKIGMNKVWDSIIYPGMKRSIIGIMLSCQDSLSVCKNRFELYGCDFILDKEYKPWLIEINSCPDLNATTSVTATICPAVISDIIKVVIDYPLDSTSSTGKFECIYRQPMTWPKYGGAADLVVRGYALDNEYFYKGNIELKEPYVSDFLDEIDIQSMLAKLKHSHDTDIMVEPDDDSDIKKEEVIADQKTESEYELSVAASVVTAQVDEILNKIPEHSDSSRSIPGSPIFYYNLSSSNSNKSLIQNIQSETNIKTLIKKSGNTSTRMETLSVVKKSFVFSKLDDGASREQSLYKLNPINRTLTLRQSSSTLSRSLVEVTRKFTYSNMIQQATTRMVTFFNKKEKEYFDK